MLKLAAPIVALAAMLAPSAPAQVPGAYPHLQLTDGVSVLVPPAAGPFDNTGVFQAYSGQSFEAKITYAAAGQPNQNVLWGLLVSGTKTPYSTTLVPPPLLTMPPLILLLPAPANLNVLGQGSLTLFVPAGILDAQTFVQAVIYDATHAPALQVSNGLAVDVDVPSFNVSFSWSKSTPANADETLMLDFGHTEIGSDVMPELKPVGLLPPPTADPGPQFFADSVRFLPIVPNGPDEPVNPLARPFTRIATAATATDTTIIVQDTSAFPTRGRILVAADAKNLWADKTGSNLVPKCEVIRYNGKLKDRFLNCQRAQLGSCSGTPPATTWPHLVNEQVLGDYTFATTSGARARTRVGLDADNEDMPHLVIPAFSMPAGPDGGTQTLDLDLYMYESDVDDVQGFVVFDRVTQTWRTLGGTAKNSLEGRWNPMVCLAPDGRSFIAELVRTGGVLGWDNEPNMVFAIRTDGLQWKSTSSESWQVTYDVTPDPSTISTTNVQSRRVIMRATAIVGPDPDNYVAFVALAHKWLYNATAPGNSFEKNKGWEGEWVREEVLVRDYIDVPLVLSTSNKAEPSEPRHYITPDFGQNGFGNTIIRFDPDVLVSPDKTRLMLTAGGSNNADEQEDVYVIRNVAISAAGAVTKVVGNVSGFSASTQSAGATAIRPFNPGGNGQGRKAAFSPGGTRVAWVAKRDPSTTNNNADWLQYANANGSSYGKVKYVYDVGNKTFKENGAYVTDRVISGLRFVDEDHILFMMGKNPYSDVAAVLAGNVPLFDLFVYDIPADKMTNLTLTGGGATGFLTLGLIAPAGYFASDNGDYSYFFRAGSLPLGAPVVNLVGINHDTLQVFPVSGTEFAGEPLIANLDLPSTELLVPVESVTSMRPSEATGVQEGLLWFTAHLQGGNGSDELFAVNLDMPFVAFQATSTSKIGLHMKNIVSDPFGGKVAFARTDGTDATGATQHPFVVDLDNFLFERDVLPMWVSGGANLGRVMDGSFHFIAPSGSAGDALVFSFGLGAFENGIAIGATPAYYPLAAVSDLVAEPVPVVIQLIDTQLLGSDYRFYVPFADLASD